ncbi:MAG: TlpA family protein disulfide reductase [Anaerolineales bacterium]|nr:TlpA family protein disulfide reductase [Anaerolineales bacterium]
MKIGQKAPDFSALTLQGKTVTLADYAGHAAAFVFVSPDCKPCREELPRLRELLPNARGFGTELVLVSDGDEEKTRPLMDGLGDGLSVLLAPREHNPFFSDYKAIGTPSYCLIDTNGKVQAAGIGMIELAERIEALVSNKERR